ncbi:MAG: PAS domain S-box protein [Candidatus Kapabacteria bacterium]|nr:PAS domain S-box protein [Ignavibacteriota bacterium]MCW5886018.1 PAS domain S-box protein [Candidatus Kapabacteria bacterium]
MRNRILSNDKSSNYQIGLIIFGIFAFLSVVLSGWFYYHNIEDDLIADKTEQLTSIANLKINQIESLLLENINDARAKIYLPQNYNDLNLYIASNDLNAKKRLIDAFKFDIIHNLYKSVLICDSTGSVLLSTDTLNQDYLKEHLKYKLQNMKSLDKDYYIYISNNNPEQKNQLEMLLRVRLYDLDKTIYAVIIDNPDNDLFRIVESWPIESQTAESIIIRQYADSIYPLTKLKHEPYFKDQKSVSVSMTQLPAAKALKGELGIVRTSDYQNKRVLAHTSKLKYTDWYIITKIDEVEIFKDLKFKTLSIILFASLWIILIIVVIILLNQMLKKKLISQKLINEQKISKAKNIFMTTVYSMNEGLIITDEENKIIHLNSKAELLTGDTEENLKHKLISDVLAFVNTNDESLNFDGNNNYDVLISDSEGIVRNINIVSNIIKDNFNRVLGYVYSLVDKTQEILAQNSILESENKFKSIFNGSNQGIMMVELEEMKIEIANEKACELFCYSCEVMQKMTLNEIVSDNSRTKIEDLFTEIIDSKKAEIHGLECITGQSEFIYCDVNLGLINTKDGHFAVCFFNDVTEKIFANKKLYESITRFTQVTEISNELIWELNTEGCFTFINSVSENMLGYKPEEIIGKKYFFDFHPEEDREKYIVFAESVWKSGQTFRNFENVMIHRDGSLLYVLSSGAPYFDEHGNILGYRGSDTDITEQRKYQDSLKFSESRFRNISECISDISFSCKMDSLNKPKIVWMIGATEKITGYTIEELIKMECWGKIVHPEDLQTFDLNVVNIKRGETGFCKIRLIAKDNSIVWVESFVKSSVYNSDSNNHIIFGALRDITHSQVAEELLERERTFFENLFRFSPEGIVLLDNQDRVLDCNIEFEKLFGFKKEEIKGLQINDLIVPDNFKIEGQNLTNAVAIGKKIAFETKRQTKDGKLIDVSILGKPIIHTDGNQLAVYGIYRNISEQKLFENALKQSEEKNRAIVQAIPDLFFIIANDGTFRDCLVHDESRLYLPKSQFMGKNVSDVMPEHVCKLFFNALDRLNQTNQIQIFDFNLVLNGSNLWYEDRVLRINSEEILIISRDITDRKQIEDELITAKEKAEQSDRLKTSFLANMSHELRTPMSGIMGFTHLLADPNITAEEHSEFLSLLERSNKRLLNLINDILDLARIEAGKVDIVEDNFNINYLINDIAQLYYQSAAAKELNLEVFCSLIEDDAVIFSDQNKHHQIISNLVSNAIKFTEKGRIVIGYELIDDFVEIYVSDTGTGISDEFLPSLFDRFRQEDTSFNRTYEGAGLGLSIVKGLVEILGGEIRVETKKEEGTKFSYTIPYKKSNEKFEIGAKSVFEDDFGNIIDESKIFSILVAEDDLVNFLYIQKTLKRIKNVTLIHAENGRMAVDLFNLHSDIKLVLMDIKMPEMDGLTATKEILKQSPDAKIIAVTAYAQPDDRDDALDAGCIDYIAKPFLPEKLLEIVAKHLDVD